MTKTETEALQILFNNYGVAALQLRDALANNESDALLVREALDNKLIAQMALLEMGVDINYDFLTVSKRGRYKAWEAINVAEAKLYA